MFYCFTLYRRVFNCIEITIVHCFPPILQVSNGFFANTFLVCFTADVKTDDRAKLSVAAKMSLFKVSDQTFTGNAYSVSEHLPEAYMTLDPLF